MKKVAMYCRVSSDKQKEKDTIENQVDILRTYVEMKDDFEIYNEFLDDGVSGTIDFMDRPEGMRVIEGAKNKEFDILLVWKIDRLGRDTLSGLNAVEVLTSYGIEIISVTEPFDLNTPIGRFQFINYLNMAELERNNILDRMYLGATRAAKQGKWMGGIVPYGYYKNKDGYLEINEYEANVVRKIYDLYTNENMNTFHIALYLVNLGIDSNYATRGVGKYDKSKAKSLWSNTSVLRILTSTTYKGIHEYGKRGTRRKELIVRKVPAIVPVEVWDQAQKKKKENQINAKKNSPNRLFILRGLLKCGECGKNYSGVHYTRQPSIYSCRGKLGVNRKLYGTKCNSCTINALDVEEFVWNSCKEFMKRFDDIVKDSKNDSEEEFKLELEGISNKLSSLKNEKNNILKLFRKELITEDELDEQLKDVKDEEEKLNKRTAEIKSKLSLFSSKNKEIEKTKDYITFYKDRLEHLSDEEKARVIKELVNEIVVTDIIEGGKKIPTFNIRFKITDLLSATAHIHCHTY